jgi:hypothetical protein
MEKIIMKRWHGKTTQLIKESASSGDYIVCHNQNEAKVIADKAKKLELDIPFPITYLDFIEKRYSGKNISGFLIDNADLFLQKLTNVPINGITITP